MTAQKAEMTFGPPKGQKDNSNTRIRKVMRIKQSKDKNENTILGRRFK